MVYSGLNTDIERGQKYVDKYNFITNNGLDTLLRFGNLLVSSEHLELGILSAGQVEYEVNIEKVFKNNIEKIVEAREICRTKLAEEIERLVGFKVQFRVLPPKYAEYDVPCIIIEKI